MTNKNRSIVMLIIGLIAATAINSCAISSVKKASVNDANGGVSDPLEKVNRAVYKFNDAFDRHLLKPVAGAYDRSLPKPIRIGINNFFHNAYQPTVIVNDLLQGKFKQAAADTGRFLVNTTVGLLGFIDVASKMRLERHEEDFGQTFAAWGLKSGPYLVLPFLGPSNLRDGAGLIPYYLYTYPLAAIESRGARWSAMAIDTVNDRANLLTASAIMEEAALDRYVFLREAYYQKRRNLIYDGNPPLDYFLLEE